MPTSVISSKGQTVIPKAIRDHLGLQPGDAVDFIVQEGGSVLIRPATENVRALKGLLHRAGRAPVPVEKMHRAIRERKGKAR